MPPHDGGPWVSYPSRKGKPLSAWDGKTFDLGEYHRSQRVNPTPLEELEPFIQTWLYFGLLAEFLCVNVSQLGIASPLVDQQEFKEIVNHIYKTTLVQDGNRTYVNLDSDCLDLFLQRTRPRLAKDPEIMKNFYQHLNVCLACTKSVLAFLPPHSNHAVKCSIAALRELLMHAVITAFQFLGLKESFNRSWGVGFLDKEAKNSMKSHG